MIPKELQALDRWCQWRQLKGNKIPCNLKGQPFKWSKEKWWSYDLISGMENKGFYLVGTDYVVIDLDNCFEGRELKPFARKAVDFFKSYTEYSPSRKGLHIWVKANFQKVSVSTIITELEDEKNELVEIFGEWWITITGDVFEGLDTIKYHDKRLDVYYNKYFPQEAERPPQREFDPDDVREQIRQSLDFRQIIRQYLNVPAHKKSIICPWHNEKIGSFYIGKRTHGYCYGACKKGYDVFDVVIKANNCSFPEALEILAKEAGVKIPEYEPDDVNAIETGNAGDEEEERFEQDKPLKISIGDVKDVIHKWLYMEDDTAVDVMLGTFISNKLDGDPVWTVFIGPPSNAKTELLRTFNEHDNAYFLSNMTPSTLVSGMGTGKKAQSKAEKASLLLRLDGKTLILKDFTTILSMRSENKQEILSQFREIYDGKYSKTFGTGVEISWEGKIGLITACTPVYDKHYGVIGALGDRFILYRSDVEDADKMADRAMEMVGREKEMREELKEIVHGFVNQFGNMNGVKLEEVEEDISEKIKKLAVLCSTLRTHVDRNPYDKSIEYRPLAEGPARLAKQFMQLGHGIALVHGKTTIDSDIYNIICKIAHNLVSTQRMDIMYTLYEGDDYVSTTKVSEAVHQPPSTTLYKLEDLMVIDVVERKTGTPSSEGGRKPWLWMIKDRMKSLISQTQLFNEYTVRIKKDKNINTYFNV